METKGIDNERHTSTARSSTTKQIFARQNLKFQEVTGKPIPSAHLFVKEKCRWDQVRPGFREVMSPLPLFNSANHYH